VFSTPLMLAVVPTRELATRTGEPPGYVSAFPQASNARASACKCPRFRLAPMYWQPNTSLPVEMPEALVESPACSSSADAHEAAPSASSETLAPTSALTPFEVDRFRMEKTCLKLIEDLQ
jgi:hypothetical protein